MQATIPISAIVIGENRRELKNVQRLAESIKTVGLINPIAVTEEMRLIAGYHRLNACKQLGWTDIPVNVMNIDKLDAELAEIDENLQRNELTVLERSEQLERRKEIYEVMFPETKATYAGGTFKGNQHNQTEVAEMISGTTQDESNDLTLLDRANLLKERKDIYEALHPETKTNAAPQSFAMDTASKTGLTDRTIQQEVQISKNIAPEVKEAIRHTPIADNKTDLLALARKPVAEQLQIAEKITAGEATITEIKQDLKPHVANNSGNNEWYTPPEIIKAVRELLVNIDCDPASCEQANKTVQAKTYYTAQDDGLTKPWNGQVFMNPPYSTQLVSQFCDALVQKFKSHEVAEAVVLVNNATETQWFQNLSTVASGICFPKGRIKFIDIFGKPSGTPLQGQALIYLGDDFDFFKHIFTPFGLVVSCC